MLAWAGVEAAVRINGMSTDHPYRNVMVAISSKAGPWSLGIRDAVARYLEGRECRVEWVEIAKDRPFEPRSRDMDLAIAVGGDGTVRLVAQWLVDNGLDVPLGIVPRGSMNTLATSLGIPLLSVRRALDLMFDRGEPRAIDAGMINGSKLFLIAVGFGVAANAIQSTRRRWKRLFGAIAYAGGLAQSLRNMPEQSFAITADGTLHERTAKTLLVFNVNRIAFFQLGPGIDMHDGELDLAVASPKSFLGNWKVVISWMLKRYSVPGLLEYIRASRFRIEWDEDARMIVDGDAFEASSPLDIRVLKGSLRVITKRQEP